MVLNIIIETTPEFDRKMNTDWDEILSDILNEVSQEAYDYITNPGVGVKGGAEPSGGAPVDTGNLITNHKLNQTSQLEKTIDNNVDYAQYVINGTSTIPPNDYPQRTIEYIINQGYIQKAVEDNVKKLNLD